MGSGKILKVKGYAKIKNAFIFLFSRVENFFEAKYPALGVSPSTSRYYCDALRKYDFFDHFRLWPCESIFPLYNNWKSLTGSYLCRLPKLVLSRQILVYCRRFSAGYMSRNSDSCKTSG